MGIADLLKDGPKSATQLAGELGMVLTLIMPFHFQKTKWHRFEKDAIVAIAGTQGVLL